MVKLFSLKSPDEWATTKQACRDTYVVTCFLPSTIRILALLYVLSTVLRISSSNLLYIYINEMIQVEIVTIMTQIFSLSSSAVNLHHFLIK